MDTRRRRFLRQFAATLMGMGLLGAGAFASNASKAPRGGDDQHLGDGFGTDKAFIVVQDGDDTQTSTFTATFTYTRGDRTLTGTGTFTITLTTPDGDVGGISGGLLFDDDAAFRAETSVDLGF